MHSNHNSLSMGFVKAYWLSQGPFHSTSNPTITVHGLFYHYLCALVSPANLRHSFLSTYIHHIDYAEQANIRTTQVLKLAISIVGAADIPES